MSLNPAPSVRNSKQRKPRAHAGDISIRRPRVSPCPSLEIKDERVPHAIRESAKYQQMMKWIRSNSTEQRSFVCRQLHQLIESSILEAQIFLDKVDTARTRMGISRTGGSDLGTPLRVLDESYEWFVKVTGEPHLDNARPSKKAFPLDPPDNAHLEDEDANSKAKKMINMQSRSDTELRRPRTASTYSGSATSLRFEPSSGNKAANSRPQSAMYYRKSRDAQELRRPRSAALASIKERPGPVVRNRFTRPLTSASSSATFVSFSSRDLSRPTSAFPSTGSLLMAKEARERVGDGTLPPAVPPPASRASAEMRKWKDRKELNEAMEKWEWEIGKLETEIARNAERNHPLPVEVEMPDVPRSLAARKILNWNWLLGGRYNTRTKKAALMRERTTTNDNTSIGKAADRCELLLRMRERRREQIADIAVMANRLRELGTIIDAELLERALLPPEQKLRDTASFPSMPRLLSDPNLPPPGTAVKSKRKIGKKSGKKKKGASKTKR